MQREQESHAVKMAVWHAILRSGTQTITLTLEATGDCRGNVEEGFSVVLSSLCPRRSSGGKETFLLIFFFKNKSCTFFG